MQNTLGLYIHVPFCLQKCGYCDFYSMPGDGGRMDAYLKAVTAHLREAGEFCGKYTVDSVYIGGGTPTLLGARRVAAILKSCRRYFRFGGNVEVTVEANPGTVDQKLLKKLLKAGVNRLSLGVQSLDDDMLLALNRAHTAEQAMLAYDDARKAGFRNISVDLLYGLPETASGKQTLQHWERTLREVLSWHPEHISCYALKLEEGTPIYKKRGVIDFPDDSAQADQYLMADEMLTAAGFRHYEISNFAKPSRESRHNLKYWTLDPYMGFGPSAHSDFDGRRFSIVADLDAYIDGISSRGEIMADNEHVPILERAGEYLMLNLRTDYGVSSNEYTRLFRASFDTIEAELIRFEQHGLADRIGDRWRLTPKGFLVSNALLGRILRAPVERRPKHID